MSKRQAVLFGESKNPAETNSRGNLLLVDDDPVLRSLLRNALEDEGFRVCEAESRSDARKLLQADENGIAVAIVDLGLPPLEHITIEGLELIRYLGDENASMKIIVLTGQDEEQSALEAVRLGAFDFIAKPARTSDIILSVERAMLFHRKEQDLMADGMARLQLSTRYEDGLKAVREEAEEKLVRQVLRDTGFNVYKSAEKLGIKRESIYYFMKKFGISRDDN